MSVSPEWLEFLREQFPKGSRIELRQQDSSTLYRLPDGSRGTLDCIDDSGVLTSNGTAANTSASPSGRTASRSLSPRHIR